MKIYYDLPTDMIEKAPHVDDRIANLSTEKLASIINGLIDSFNDTQHKLAFLTFEKMKLDIMWHLRSLDERITAESGIIRIESEGNVSVLGFSDELREEILTVLNIDH
jgi:hypothetical protein